jgi:chromosomal replication initiation ATPase DnaA
MTPTEQRIRARPQLLELVQEVCDARMLVLDDVCGRRRFKASVAGRHECWWHLRQMGFSYPQIASWWDVDHTTVLEAVKGFGEGDE